MVKGIMVAMQVDWRAALEAEFALAARARAEGKEGRARVCARRAAGVAIRENLARRGLPIPSVSAYDLLSQLALSPETSPRIKVICDHLTLRVTEEFTLPVGADLVEESRQLCATLLPDWLS